MTISIFTTDASLMIRSWDSQLATMTGISQETACGSMITDIIPDLQSRGLDRRFQRVIKEGVVETLAPALHHYLIPCSPLTPSTQFEQMQQRVTIAPLREQDQVVGTIVTIEDVTARMEGEREVNNQLFQASRQVSTSDAANTPTAKASDQFLLSMIQQDSWQTRKEAVSTLAQRSAPEINRELLALLRKEHRNPNILNSVLQVLAISNIDPIPALIECLHEPDNDLRIYAALALGERNDQRAIPALMGALDDPDKNVCYHAIDALGNLRANQAVDKLMTIAESGDFFLAFPAFDALMRIGDATVTAKLIPLLQSNLNWRVRREAVDNLALNNDPNLTRELLRLLREQHRNPDILNSVLQVLALSDVDPIPSLIECLQDQDQDLRIYAALALGERHDHRAIPALIVALDDPNTNVRYHAIDALGHLRATEAVDKLVSLASSGDFFLSFPAIEALIKIGDPFVAPQLIPLLNDELLNTQVLDALGQLGTADVIVPMASYLNQPDAPVSEIAIAVAKIYHRYEQEFREGAYIAQLAAQTINDIGINNLIKSLGRAEGEELKALVLILGCLEGSEIEQALSQLLGRAEVRDLVVNALVSYGSRVSDLLISQLDVDDLETRKAAVTALGIIGSTQAVPALTRLLDAELELVMITASALAQIGDQSAFEALLTLLGHPETTVRLAAIAALNSLGHREMPQRIYALLDDDNPLIRESAVKIAGYFAYEQCLDKLIQSTHDPEEKVRRAAIEQLPYLDDPQALAILTNAIANDTPTVRATAAQALGEFESLDIFPYLLQALEDSAPWVRYQAAKSLGKSNSLVQINHLHKQEAIKILEKLVISDEAPQVRAAATEALGRIGDDKALPLLTKLTEEETDQQDIARAALMALSRIKDAQAVPALLNALNSSNPQLRLDAIQAFRERGGTDAGVALQWMAAADSEKKVIQAAIESLARMATPESISYLLELTVDPISRDHCIQALASHADHSSVSKVEYIEAIAQGLNHLHAAVRSAVVEILKRCKHPHASEFLVVALNDQDQGVRLAAVNAIIYLGNRAYLSQLEVLARSDPSPAVRRAAYKVLHS